MNKNGKPIIAGILIILLLGGITYKEWKTKKEDYKTTDIEVVLSLEDTISKNAIWCGTFNLIWNDLKTELVKKDIEFNPQLEIVENLNKGTFTTNDLSDTSYIKKLGHPTYALKEEIEKEIKTKFNETSDILDDFEWKKEETEDYLLYAMLKKEFTYPKEFTALKTSKFKNTENVSYFGIDSVTDESVYKQVEVLYYNNSSDFAIKLRTQENEEIILSRGNTENTFKAIYEEIEKKSTQYQKSKSFQKGDTLKIPYLNLKIKKEFTELENKDFYFANGKKYYIDKALQTISLELNEHGGKIKSEAGMEVKQFSALESSSRMFHFDDEFVFFLKEKDKSLPYFATKITDIEKFN